MKSLPPQTHLTAEQQERLDAYERFNADVRSRPDYATKWAPMSELIVERAFGHILNPARDETALRDDAARP